MDRTVSREQIASWTGCTLKTVDGAAWPGLIVARPRERTRGMPSLDRKNGRS